MKDYKIFLCSSAVCVFAAVFVAAQEIPAPLTLRRCMSLAEANSSELKIQSEKLKQAGYAYAQAWSGVWPAAGYEYAKLYRDTAGGAYQTGLSDSKFTFRQPIFYGFRNTSAISYAKALVRKEELQYKTLHRNLEAVLTSAFYDLALADADMANVKNSFKLLNERLGELKDRVRLGKSRRSEALAVESQLATLEANEQKSYYDRSKAVEALAFLTGLSPDSIAIIDDAPLPPGPGDLRKYIEAVRDRSDIEAARQDIVAQSYRLKAAKGAFLPTVNLDGSFYHIRSGSMADSRWETLLSVELPLFQGGARRSVVKQEASRLMQFEESVLFLERRTETEVRGYYRLLDSSLKQAAAYGKAYDKAGESYRIQIKDYRYGLVNNLDVIQAMTGMLEAKKNLDRALIEVKSAKALLDITAE